MSWQATAIVKGITKGISRSEKLLLFLLADCHNPHTTQCNPSIPRLAQEGLMSERTVLRAIAHLEEKKLLKVTRHLGRTHTNDYILCFLENPDILSPFITRQKVTSQKKKGDILGIKGDILPLKGDTATSPEETEPKLTEPKDRTERIPRRTKISEIPSLFLSLETLPGFKKRNYEHSVEIVRQTCAEGGVASEEIVQEFADYYRLNRLRHGWSDPVKALVNTLAVQISKHLERRNGKHQPDFAPQPTARPEPTEDRFADVRALLARQEEEDRRRAASQGDSQ